MSIAYYPLPAIGVSRGAPRYAMYEPTNMSLQQYDEEPLDGEEYEEEYYPEDEEGMEFEEGDLDENGVITADDVLQGGGGGFGGGFGNALAPALPEYLRNSMMSLDSWQQFEGEKETEREVSALEDELADLELKAKMDLEQEKKGSKITKWHIMMIAGIATTLIAVLFFIMKRVK